MSNLSHSRTAGLHLLLRQLTFFSEGFWQGPGCGEYSCDFHLEHRRLVNGANSCLGPMEAGYIWNINNCDQILPGTTRIEITKTICLVLLFVKRKVSYGQQVTWSRRCWNILLKWISLWYQEVHNVWMLGKKHRDIENNSSLWWSSGGHKGHV